MAAPSAACACLWCTLAALQLGPAAAAGASSRMQLSAVGSMPAHVEAAWQHMHVLPEAPAPAALLPGLLLQAEGAGLATWYVIVSMWHPEVLAACM